MNAEVNLTELKEYYGFQNESAWIWKNTIVFRATLVGFEKICVIQSESAWIQKNTALSQVTLLRFIKNLPARE